MTKTPKPFIRHSRQLICNLKVIQAAGVIKSGLCDTLIAIAMHWNPKGKVFPSQDRLAALAGIHRRTTITHVKKLTELGVISTEDSEANISQYRPTLNYTFNDFAIKELLKRAKKILKEKARKALLAKEKQAEKDHTPPPEIDHIKQSLPLQAKDQGRKNTVKKKSLNGLFLKSILEAVQHELAHLNQLAYKAATTANQIKRGEIFSKAEIARREAKAKRMRALHEAAAATQQERTKLATDLLTHTAIKPTFNDSKLQRLIEIVGCESKLAELGAMIPLKLKQYREAAALAT